VTSLLGGGAHAIGGLAAAGGHEIAAMGPPEMPGPRGSMGQVPGPDSASGPMGAYNLDKLLRSNSSGPAPDFGGPGARGPDARTEVMHIAANTATTGEISDEDRSYLVNLVAAKTGVSTNEAQKRVDAFIQSVKDAVAQAKSAADGARKAAATAALYTALALLIGAFIASVSAAIGGRLRDEHL